MKDFLESLEIGEGKEHLTVEQIKSILAENGKVVNTETAKVEDKYKQQIKTSEDTIADLKKQMENIPSNDEIEKLKTKITEYETAETNRKAEEESAKQDKILNENIAQVFGDKKFTSEYAKNGLMNDIKTELAKVENKGKGIKDIFESLTKDSTGIFANDNEVTDMPPAGEVTDEVTKSMGEVKLNPMFKNYN